MAKASIVIARLAGAIAAVVPVEAIAVGVNSSPALHAAFEVEGEAVRTCRRSRRIRVVTTIATSQFSVINRHDVHVVAVEVTEGDVNLLSSVSAEVNAIVVPGANSFALAFT